MERLSKFPALAVIPVIVVSARDAHANRERAIKAGAKAFLQKPVDDAELLATIRKALGEPEHLKKPDDEQCSPSAEVDPHRGSAAA